MATAAGLVSPGLVSLVKRAQKLREENVDVKVASSVVDEPDSVSKKKD